VIEWLGQARPIAPQACWVGQYWDPVQQKCVPVGSTPSASSAPLVPSATIPILPAVPVPQCPFGQVFDPAQQKCVLPLVPLPLPAPAPVAEKKRSVVPALVVAGVAIAIFAVVVR
jgi:hypothetical protein